MSDGRQPAPRGEVRLIIGCMFAGKTTELIRRVQDARRRDIPVALFSPASDSRSGVGWVRAHGGHSARALPIAAAAQIGELSTDASIVAVDESHFFGEELVGVTRALASAGRCCVLAGLERDHRGELFEPFRSLLPVANEILRLAAPCARCGAPAIHSQRMFASSERIAVGGAGQYEPRCRACFEPGT